MSMRALLVTQVTHLSVPRSPGEWWSTAGTQPQPLHDIVFPVALRQIERLAILVTGKPLSSAPADATLKILVIDENPIRRAILDAGLREAGFTNVILLGETTGLLDRIHSIEPDVILIDLESPSRDMLEQMFQVSRVVHRPVAMFVDQSDRDTTKAAIEAGVSAYIVDGLRKERVEGIVDLCVLRFNAMAHLQDELERAKTALEDRKIIDRAKGILMRAKGLTEDQAYALLRKTAMNEKRKIAEVSQAVITAAELLK